VCDLRGTRLHVTTMYETIRVIRFTKLAEIKSHRALFKIAKARTRGQGQRVSAAPCHWWFLRPEVSYEIENRLSRIGHTETVIVGPAAEQDPLLWAA